jgi:outer membrane protein assembly factor BamE (lipoprotein component of BamABCDE complex)
MPPTRMRDTLLVATVLAAACAASAGCVWLPGNFRPVDGSMRPEEKIGPSEKKLLHVGRSTRDNVASVLGGPTSVATDGRHWVYEYSVASGWTFWPLWLVSVPDYEERYLDLAFDDAGTLTAYSVDKDFGIVRRRAAPADLASVPQGDTDRDGEATGDPEPDPEPEPGGEP